MPHLVMAGEYLPFEMTGKPSIPSGCMWLFLPQRKTVLGSFRNNPEEATCTGYKDTLWLEAKLFLKSGLPPIAVVPSCRVPMSGPDLGSSRLLQQQIMALDPAALRIRGGGFHRACPSLHRRCRRQFQSSKLLEVN